MSASRPRTASHLKALEARRLQAATLFALGERNRAAIARELNVSRQSVARWFNVWRSQRTKGLRSANRLGRKPKLSAAQSARLATDLRQPPSEWVPWTVRRIVRHLDRRWKVTYHPKSIPRLLRRLGIPSLRGLHS